MCVNLQGILWLFIALLAQLLQLCIFAHDVLVDGQFLEERMGCFFGFVELVQLLQLSYVVLLLLLEVVGLFGLEICDVLSHKIKVGAALID